MRWAVYEHWSPFAPAHPRYLSSIESLLVAVFFSREDATQFANQKFPEELRKPLA
jgi:hypothetical protein